jgi:succinate dehydrogenase/fumarate reductase flavoprotein subunit
VGDRYDVVVCGAGMAGLCTAVTALEAGARVLVVEKGPAPGGSMRMSGGTLWTAPSMEIMERYVPGGDRVRQRQLVDSLDAGVAWLESVGISWTGTIALPRQVGREFNTAAFTDHMAGLVAAKGGELRVSTALDGLVRGKDGRIAEARLRSVPGGARSEVAASAVVLATGGFQGSRELKARWIGRWADTMLHRANPNSVGEGLLAATAVGARTSPNLATFYGHTMPAPPAAPPPDRWTKVTQYASADTILVNLHGERFFDESRSLADETAPFEIVQQPEGLAVLLMDRRVHDGDPLDGRSGQPAGGQFDNAAAEPGARSVRAATLDELADGVAAWGVSRRGLLATISEFNDAVGAGRGADLRVPRRGSPFGLVEPPFYALLVRAAITFTNGGAEADAEMRVIDTEGNPIPGLFAAGADAGGTYQAGYMGGLVLGLVPGRIAGAGAAAYARASSGVAVA